MGDAAHPTWRAKAVGAYRFWRDAGYAAGAVVAGVVADRWGATLAIALVGLVALGSGGFVTWSMPGIIPPAHQAGVLP